jgi:hypothetical protein
MTDSKDSGEMLSIGDFVAATITEIARGLNLVSEQGREDLRVFPENEKGHDTVKNTTIRFDLAVSAFQSEAKKNKSGGNIGVLSAIIGLGLSGSMTEGRSIESSAASRIQFDIEVHFPAYKVDRDKINLEDGYRSSEYENL